ncbi:MAG TPA: hypothetical protein VJ813_17130 [Vicinamibacterales bacterium]|nr:hypothetical protein [Vicinamibacterales bacterium]
MKQDTREGFRLLAANPGFAPVVILTLALGADGTFRLVVFGALRVLLVGVALGLAGAVAAGRSLQNLLFGVPPSDLLTFVASGMTLVAIGVCRDGACTSSRADRPRHRAAAGLGARGERGRSRDGECRHLAAAA